MLRRFTIGFKDLVTGDISFINVQKVIIAKEKIIIKTFYTKEEETYDKDIIIYFDNIPMKDYNLDDLNRDSFSTVFKFYKYC